MDSDLLDISGEVEESFLLNNLPSEGVSLVPNSSTGSKNGYLNCSPLQIPRSNHLLHARPPLSPIGEVMGRNTELPSPSIVTDSVDKENVSGNKVELSKLSVERQQMKKKKKTGFNLRKSLAWDRAFFTEEGVLDSVELSIITGNDCQIGGEMLPTIQEERRESILASNCSSDTPGLRAIEENLFKALPVNSKSKERKVVGGVLPKNASPSKATSLAQRKLFSAQDARSSSKSSGCPRHLASSSPANAHMATAQNKELRVSKVSATRSDSLKVANTVKKSTQSPSKVKQIQSAQSLGNAQRSLGSTSSSKKTTSAQTKTKSSMASKSSIPKPSVKQARRNVISTASKIPPASNSQHSVAVKSGDGLMTTSDLVLPGLGHGINFHDSCSSKVVSVPQSSRCSTENMLSSVPRVPRPSGLRMPSPSIGFFSQSKYPSHGSVENSSQALPRSDSATDYSLIPTFKKSQVAGKVPKVNIEPFTGNISSLGSITGLSAPSELLQPSLEKMKTKLKSTSDKVLKTQCNPVSSLITKSLQHPSVIPDDADKITLDNATLCKYEIISSEKVGEWQSNSKTLPFCSKNNEQEDKPYDGKGGDVRKTCTTKDRSALLLKHGPTFEDFVDPQLQCSSDNEYKTFDNYSQVKVSNLRGGNTINDFKGDLDGIDAQGQSSKAFLLPGNEDKVGICHLGEKHILAVDHSAKNVSKQLEVSDSWAVHPAFREACAPIESNIDDLSSSGNQSANAESGLISLGLVETQDSITLPYNNDEDNMVSDSIQCGHVLVHDGQALTQQERTNKFRDNTEANCEADLVDAFLDCREPLRESEDQHFSCQLIPEVKGGRKTDVVTRNETTDRDDGPEVYMEFLTVSAVAENMEQVNIPMPFREFEDQQFSCQLVSEVKKRDHEIDAPTSNETADADDDPEMDIECLTGSPVAEQNVEQLNIPISFSPEVRMEDQTLKTSHEPFPERLTSEEYKQSNCCDIANKSEEGVGLQIGQTDQLGPSDGCSSTNVANEAVASCSNMQHEINSVQKDIDLVIETELISNHKELCVMDNLKEGFMEFEATQTVSDMSERTNAFGIELKSPPTTSSDPSSALGTELNGSVTSNPGDPKSLSEDTDLSRIAECIPKKVSNSGSVEKNKCVEKTECKTGIMIRIDKESCAHDTDQELCPQQEEEVQVVKSSTDHEELATRKEESGTPVFADESVPVEEIVQPDEFTVLSADTSISENNGADASESGSSPRVEILEEFSTYFSEDADKMNFRDAKFEKRPDPLIVKPPPNAVPFSDEWLAAIEAAGEEILSVKTGPVQHSPPEKPAHEPGPWSPVKRKNNQGVGPFDCTKFTSKGLPLPSD